jgi:hypothetical protein
MNTLTKPYQGCTYQATLATTGRKVVITVEAGYLPDCYGDWEQDYILVAAPCAVWAYSDSAVEKAQADGWQVTAICPSDGPVGCAGYHPSP